MTREWRGLVAVVDDEERVRLALSRLLRAAGFEVVLFPAGDAFLATTHDPLPDCVVLDFQMPGLSGRDVQRALARSQVQIPVIVVTAHDQPTLREQCLADGAVAYLLKPLRRETLLQAIDAAMRRPSHKHAQYGGKP